MPLPDLPIHIRPATPDDMPAMDALQKPQHKELGFFPKATLLGKIEKGEVLIAEEARSEKQEASQRAEGGASGSATSALLPAPGSSLLGYAIGADRYYRRDDIGVIFQLVVHPQWRRTQVAATLLKKMFDGWAYGCRLACCWCAQDLQANHFWESMGFVPLAYRGGGARARSGCTSSGRSGCTRGMWGWGRRRGGSPARRPGAR